ncbi:MAG TPA: MFS transporter [Burkholderiaceae bacterium]
MALDPIPRGAILALSLAAFGSGLSLRLGDPMLPMLAREFGVGLGTAANVVTMFSVAYGFAQLCFGPLGDRFGKYRVIALSSLACALTNLLCGLAQSFLQLELARLTAGISCAALIPLAMAWIGDVVPYEQRQAALARYLIGQLMGLSAGVLVGGIAADQGQWRLPFLAIAAGFVLIGFTLLAIERRLPAQARQQQASGGHPLRRMFVEFGEVLARPRARIVLLAVFLEGGCVYGAFAFIVAHLHAHFGIALTLAGSTLMLFGFGGLLYALASVQLVRRLGEARLAASGGLVLALSYLAIAWAPDWRLALPACLCAGLGFYMLHTTLQINATQMAPERRGAAMSAFAACFFLGQASGVAFNAWMVSRSGSARAIALDAAGALLVALAFARKLREGSSAIH